MKEILVNKVKPCELPPRMIFILNHLHKTELGNFVVMYDNKPDVLYVNKEIPNEDIKKFVTLAGYEGKYINNPDCEISDITNDVYQKYGFEVWGILVEAYNDRRKRKADETSRVEAKELYKIIHEFETNDDNPDIFYDKEYLIYHLWSLAGKSGRKTAENLVNYGTKYIFLFGYLMGKGVNL